MKIAGLDIGTTGCKLTVFEKNGKELDKAYHDYPVKRQVDGHEIDVSTMMEAVYAVIKKMAAQFPDIEGIGVTSFGETFVCVDDYGNPLHNAMLYTDPRGADECKTLIEKLGEKHIAEITGLRPHEMYSISKIMWLKSNMPDVYSKTKRIHLIEDYVVWHLSHVAKIDYSLATRTMAFDINKLKWSDEVFDAAGIDSSFMSTPVPIGSCAGNIHGQAAQSTGLSQNCKIVCVSHDQVATIVGTGAFSTDIAVDGAGTVQCLTAIFSNKPSIDKMYDGYFPIVPYLDEDKKVSYAFSYTGGSLIQWCMETFANGKTNEEIEKEYKSDEPTGLLVLPHFAGAANPYMDIGSKGAIVGLTSATDSATIYRACMEGVAYEMRLNYEMLKEAGIEFKKLNASGGGAKSKIWMQMKADMLNLPITSMQTVDAGTVGSAMLTGITIGLFNDMDDAYSKMVHEVETFYPRQDMYNKYSEIFLKYKKLYKAIRPLV